MKAVSALLSITYTHTCMNQKISTDSVRYAPVALAVALLATLGLVALSAQAEEAVVEAVVITEEKKQKEVQQMRDIFRGAEAAEEFGAPLAPDELQAERRVAREETRALREEQKAEFAEDRAKRLQTYRSFLDEKKQVIESRIKEHQEEKRMKQAEHKAALEVAAQIRIGQYVERIVKRMDAAIARLEQIAERIATRIEKTEEKGADLSEAKIELANVYTLIEDAHEFVALIGTASTETLTSDKPRSKEIRDAVELAKDCLVSIHGALAETVQLIRVGMEEDRDDDVEVEEETEEETETESLEEESSETE